MRTLSRAIANPAAAGREIALPWRRMGQIVTLRTMELVVVAGAPGGGKSTLAANMAMGMRVPLLYCAQDSPASVLSRMTALALGRETHDVTSAIANPDTRGGLVDEMKEVRPTLVFHRGAVSVDDVGEMALGLVEWIGAAPPVIVVDNLIDMIVPGYTHHDPQFYAAVLPQFKRLAQSLDTAIVLLHHVTRGEWATGQKPLTMNSLLFAGEREARHVWGVYNNGADTLHIQVLKQQDGPADPNGSLEIALRWFPRMARLASLEA